MLLAERLQPHIGSDSSSQIEFDVMLQPLGPALSDIRIDSELTIGRIDQPFVGYTQDVIRLLSRRHARIGCQADAVDIVDLGSLNGTSVNGVGIGQAARRLRDGDEICFGGELRYRLRISARAPVERAINRPTASAQPATERPAAERSVALTPDRTRFLDAPGAFLDVLCQDAEPNNQTERRVPAVVAATKFSMGWKAMAAAVILIALALCAYFYKSPARELRAATARGDYARAAVLADLLLQKHPDDVQLEARATDLALEANVPGWLNQLRAGDFDAAEHFLSSLSAWGTRNAELPPLVVELQWLGDLERLKSSRGGFEAPIRMYADEERIAAVIARWNDDNDAQQRALARIAASVPEFRDWYGDALSYLRHLQSASAVSLPVIARLKDAVAMQMNRDDPEALEPVLAEAAARYPDLGGLDRVRADLSQYLAIRREVRTGQSGRLFALLRTARFVTPPFEQSLDALTAAGQLPSAQLRRDYDAATQSWQAGDVDAAMASLQQMTSGPWAAQAVAESERRRAVSARFAAIGQMRSADDIDAWLAFAKSLDADEDTYFMRATAGVLQARRDSVVAREQVAVSKARMLWQDYRDSGGIDAAQRTDSAVSDNFRGLAQQLAEAQRAVQQAWVIASLIDPAAAAQWSALRGEIEAEIQQQRSSLDALSHVLQPELLKAKLALLDGSNG
jgi:hypothetical protein